MAWGRRIAPPDKGGRVPQVMLVCSKCWLLAHNTDAPRVVALPVAAVGVGGQVCEGCQTTVPLGSLWDLPVEKWLTLEVKLAVEEQKLKKISAIQTSGHTPGSLTFLAKKPDGGDFEWMRLDPDGKCYVRGELVEENIKIWSEMKAWFDNATKASEPTQPAVKEQEHGH